MKVTKFAVTYGMTVNVGNYENIRRDITIEGYLEDGDEESEVVRDMQNDARFYLAMSLMPDARARINASRWRNLDSEERVRERLRNDEVFTHIEALDTDAADVLVLEFWEEYQQLEAERQAEAAKREAEVAQMVAGQVAVETPADDDSDAPF